MMSGEHDAAEPEAHGLWNQAVENALTGVPAGPVVPAPLDSSAASLTGNLAQSWNNNAYGIPVLVPYSFATRDSSYYNDSGAPPTGEGFQADSEPFDEAQRGAVLEALKLWDRVSGLTFIEVPDAPDRTIYGIRFFLENIDSTTTHGHTRSAIPLSAGAEITMQRKFYADHPMQPGSLPFHVLLHEIGHAIGLKHPHEGQPQLPAVHDNSTNTVMSYQDRGNYSHLGPYDIAAAQYLYGTQEAEEALAVRWSRGPGGALVSTGDDAANTINGLGIRDIVYAGGGGDVIRTQAGNDDIRPGAGADTVWGGDGFDTVWAETPRRHAAAVNLGGAKELTLFSGRDLLVDVEAIRFFDGQLSFHPDLAASQAFRLYGAALGRKPDPVGLGQWAQELDTGATTLKAVAASFVASAEFAARYGTPDDAGFVSLLYANVLGRAPDAGGLGFWVGAVAAGAGRAGALLGFSESAEYKARTEAAYRQGLWAPDPEAVGVLRAYVAVLDRLPDAGGLAGWAAAREGGMAQSELVDRFVQSAEFQARFGGLSNGAFVELLYRTALDREADPDGLAAWTSVLDTEADGRAGVALGFAGSAEMTAKVTPLAADGILLA